MAICEICKNKIDEDNTYVYTMEYPNGGVDTKDICRACAEEIISAVRKVSVERAKLTHWVRENSEHLYDDIPGEIL